ncbi:MAG: hypothetical protein ACXACD_09680 [Candidatus Thorarchaeota archaeon]|jgi:hypothetical protein
MDRRIAQKSVIVLGIVIVIAGFALHFSVPGTTRSGFNVIVEGSSSAVDHIFMELGDARYEFGIEMLPPGQYPVETTTGYLLTPTEYERYMSGTPIEDVDALLQFGSGERTSYEASLTTELSLYIVFFNNGSDLVSWTYYYVILPSGFYPTFIFGFSGLFICMAGLGWISTGWKRYFVIGVSINLVLFFLRTFTLASYSLGLPEIFEELIHVELYNDYQFFYLSWVPSLREGAWAYSSDLAIYFYPPLWIYTVSILGSVPSWLPGVPLFAFNVGTGYFVYMIAKSLTHDERYPIYAKMLYLLNPLTLFYGSFMWLNPTPYVFFTTVSFYLALSEREELSIAAIAIATLYKQLAVVFFPILSIVLLKKRLGAKRLDYVRGFIKHTAIYAGIVFLVSVPFLIVSPEQYLNQMLFWHTGSYDTLRTFIPELWMTVHLNTFFLWLGAPPWFIDIIALLLVNYIFLIICALVVYGTFAIFKPQDSQVRAKELVTQALLWGFVAVMCVQLFYPRGAYKFYLLALAPFVSVLYDYRNLELNQGPSGLRRHHLVPLALSWIVFVCYRFVYFWVLGAWLIFYLWKSGSLSRIAGVFRLIIRPPDVENTSISVYEEIYGDDLGEFDEPLTNESAE